MSTRAPKRIAISVVERTDEFDNAQVLIGQRPEGVPLAGYWEFPGGKVREGESYEDAAVRECLEETQLHIEIVDEYPSTNFEYEHDTVLLRFFRCHMVGSNQLPQNGFRWVPTSKLKQYEFPQANAALVALLSGSSD